MANLRKTDVVDVNRNGTVLENVRKRVGKLISLYVDCYRVHGSKNQMSLCLN